MWPWGVQPRLHWNRCQEWGNKQQRWRVAVEANMTGSQSQVGSGVLLFLLLKERFEDKNGHP